MKRLVEIAKITRLHGFPREGAVVLKLEVFAIGGESLKGRKSAFFSKAQSSNAHPPSKESEENSYHEIPFLEDPDPWGGAWGKARGVLLKFKEIEAPEIGARVALPRESFAPLGPSEVYICDLLGLGVRDEARVFYGKITSFTENKAGQVNLHVEGGPEAFDFPLSWMDLDASQAAEHFPLGEVIVPQVKEWLR